MDINELEKTIWQTAKRLRKNVHFHDCMHIVLGLVFLKFITDITEEKVGENLSKEDDSINPNLQEQEKYVTYNEFFVPKIAQWTFLQSNAKFDEIGVLLDEVVDALEKLNENIRGILPGSYSDPRIDKAVLGELIQIIGGIGFGKKLKEKKELLAKVFEYLLNKFAQRENIGSQAYTTQNIAQLLVEMVEPRKGIIYDGSCGAGNMFVEASRHVKKYRGKIEDLLFFGQDNSTTIVNIARMNLMINDLFADLKAVDSIQTGCHTNLKADFILSSPFFDSSGTEHNISPFETSSLAWLQQSVLKLNSAGVVAVALPSNSLNSNLNGDRKIRQELIEARLVDCIVSLPPQLFPKYQTPACLWILNKNKTNNKYTKAGDEVLFIDAGKLEVFDNKLHKSFSDEGILIISRTYHRWRNINGDYIDRKGFCKAVAINEISRKKYDLQPLRYTAIKRAKKAIPALIISVAAALLFFINFKSSSLITMPSDNDTSSIMEAKMTKDSLQHRNVYKTVKRKLKDKPIREKDNSGTEAAQNKSVAKTAVFKKNTIAKEEITPVNNYKVISKAYFYNQPDKSTRRKAFINHWNNSYADIEAEDEKNGFIYVEFTNHLNQISRGWLRKSDLREVDQ